MSKETKNNQDFDQIFREKLTGHSVPPPTNMWETVRLNTHENKRKRGILWIIANDTTIMLFAIVVSFLTLLGQSAQLLNTSNSEIEQIIPVESSTSTENNEVLAKSKHSANSENLIEKGNLLEERPIEGFGDKRSTRTGEWISSKEGKKRTSRNRNPELTKGLTPNQQAVPKSEMSEASVNHNLINNTLESGGRTSKSIPTKPEASPDEIRAKNARALSSEIGYNQPESEVAHLADIQSPQFELLSSVKPNLFKSFEENDLSLIDFPKSPINELVGSKDHEIFAGMHVNFNLPIIFNQNTLGVFGGTELAYQPTFGLASGLRLGYTFKRQYGFQTGFIFYSKQGQDYNDNVNGFTAKRQVNLQYFHVPFVFRYKFKIKKNQKFESPWVINLGGDVGILRAASIGYAGNEFPLLPIQNPESNDMDYFRPVDISLVVGVEKEIYFTKWLMLSVGLRTTFSSDINAENHPVANDANSYDKSHNFTFGLTLGLNYYMRR